jgi:hypothetical protein
MIRSVADSLVENEGADREQMDQMLEGIVSGNMARLFGGGGFGGGGARPAFRDRPGETPAVGARGAGRAGGGGAMNQNVMRQVFGALRDRGMGFDALRGRGGGGGGSPVEPGRYTVTLTVGDRTLSVPLEVMRDPEFSVDATDSPSWLFGAESWYELFERLSEADFGER